MTEGCPVQHNTRSVTALKKALAVTLSFMVIEFVGGWLSNSLALMTDAVHMLVDSLTLVLSLVMIWIARRPRTERMSYGFYRAEILGAFGSGVLLWGLTGFIIYEAIDRMVAPPEVEASVVVGIGLCGLVANFISIRCLRPAKAESLNSEAAYINVFSDLLGSLAAVLAGVILWVTGWRLIDPLLTLGFAGLIVYSSWGFLKESVTILMQGTPRGVSLQDIYSSLKKIPGVLDAHDLHIWTLTSGKTALSVHLVSKLPEATLNQAYTLLKEKHEISDITIQVENPHTFVAEDEPQMQSQASKVRKARKIPLYQAARALSPDSLKMR